MGDFDCCVQQVVGDRKPSQMQVQITRNYVSNLGDHGSETTVAYAYDSNETVAGMINRVMGFPLPNWRQPDPEAFVILRVVSGTEPREQS